MNSLPNSSKADETIDAVIGIANLPYLEALYAKYISEPESMSAEWQRYCEKANLNNHGSAQTGRSEYIPPRSPK